MKIEWINLIDWLRFRTAQQGSNKHLYPVDSPFNTLMICGPPGTGKTNLPELVAAELEWPVVTIAVGEFSKEGEGRVGQRVYELFDRLKWVSNTCLVFDEFDRLVNVRHVPHEPSRPAEHLTPTTLPLMSKLHTAAHARDFIACFTTNYIQWVDPAALRSERVSTRFCR